MDVRSVTPVTGHPYPPGTVRLDYASSVDAARDWALFAPGDTSRTTVVYLHGSFGFADQFFVRDDVRRHWLPQVQRGRHPLLSINMRGTSYMSPAATVDFAELLDECTRRFGCSRYVLLGGSGGASSAMAFAVLHPEKLHGVVAMGMCDLLHRMAYARASDNETLQRLCREVHQAYGGSPLENPEPYRERSVLAHADRLMGLPIVLSIGERDPLIPVERTREVARALEANPHFTYVEIPGGSHDSAVWIDVDLEEVRLRTGPGEAKAD